MVATCEARAGFRKLPVQELFAQQREYEREGISLRLFRNEKEIVRAENLRFNGDIVDVQVSNDHVNEGLFKNGELVDVMLEFWDVDRCLESKTQIIVENNDNECIAHIGLDVGRKSFLTFKKQDDGEKNNMFKLDRFFFDRASNIMGEEEEEGGVEAVENISIEDHHRDHEENSISTDEDYDYDEQKEQQQSIYNIMQQQQHQHQHHHQQYITYPQQPQYYPIHPPPPMMYLAPPASPPAMIHAPIYIHPLGPSPHHHHPAHAHGPPNTPNTGTIYAVQPPTTTTTTQKPQQQEDYYYSSPNNIYENNMSTTTTSTTTNITSNTTATPTRIIPSSKSPMNEIIDLIGSNQTLLDNIRGLGQECEWIRLRITEHCKSAQRIIIIGDGEQQQTTKYQEFLWWLINTLNASLAVLMTDRNGGKLVGEFFKACNPDQHVVMIKNIGMSLPIIMQHIIGASVLKTCLKQLDESTMNVFYEELSIVCDPIDFFSNCKRSLLQEIFSPQLVSLIDEESIVFLACNRSSSWIFSQIINESTKYESFYTNVLLKADLENKLIHHPIGKELYNKIIQK